MIESFLNTTITCCCYIILLCWINHLTILKAISHKKSFRCQPAMKSCQKALMMSHWQSARAEIGTPSTVLINPDFFQYMKDRSRGAKVYVSSTNVPLLYVPIFKAASEGIEANLKRSHTVISEDFNNELSLESFRKNLTLRYYGGDSSVNRLNLMTFVRDPYRRFFSSMAEMMYRTLKYGEPYNYTIANIYSYPMEVYLEVLFSGRYDRFRFFTDKDVSYPVMYQIFHVTPMSNVFFDFNISIVKHLENFDVDWEDIRNNFHIPQRFNFSLGVHERTAIHHPKVNASDDALHTRSAILKVFSEKPQFLRALCHWSMMDYICFPEYKLPAACTDLSSVREAGQLILEKCGI